MRVHHSPNLEALPGIAHAFFGRDGGISTGIYQSLNCGPGSKDDPASVAQNRERVRDALAPGARLFTLGQIHSCDVHVVGPGTQALPPGDGLATNTPGCMLGIQTADCAPVLFADAKARVIGAAHAGWKGALGGVLEATIAAMEGLGAKRQDIAVAVGPCISQDNYEVGWDFRDRFLETGLRNRKFFRPSGKEGHYHFDLEGYAAHRLEVAGIGDIARLRLCTYPPENGFFSFRRATHAGEGDYGREISAIVLA